MQLATCTWTVCGLPSDKPEFASLPPQFYPGRAVVTAAKRVCFGGLPPVVSGVAEYALASLIHHQDFLRAELPLFQNALLKNEQYVADLRECLVAEGDSSIVATGIPPYISILTELKAVKEALASQREAIARAAAEQQHRQDAIVQRMVEGVTSVLEERAAATGVPMCERLASTVMSRLEDAGLMRLLDRLENSEAIDASVQQTATPDVPEQSASTDTQEGWGSLMMQFPGDYELPTGSTEQVWLFWCCGDSDPPTPPLRRLLPRHLATSNDRKRICDLKFIMKRLDDRVEELGLSTTRVTMEEAASVYEQCRDAIELTAETEHGRKRRRGQLQWITVVSEVRRAAKRMRQAGPRDASIVTRAS